MELPRSRVRANLAANLLGKGITAAVSFAFVPLYVRYLGIDSYGLVGFFATMQAAFNIFDLGLTRTLNREMARYSATTGGLAQARNLMRTLEAIYWPIGVVIGAIVLAGAPYISTRWLNSHSLGTDVVRQAVILMGIALALQWPASLYLGALAGMQKMVRQNVIVTTLQVARGVGAVLILRYYSPTVVAFFGWQLLISGVTTAASAITLWASLPHAETPARFSKPLLASVWRFAWDMTLMSIVTVALTQADKFILSRTLPLAALGYYNMAFVVGSALNYVAYPISSTFFPRLSELAVIGEESAVARAYHAGSQMMTVMIGPAALTMIFFAPEVLLAWTGSAVTAHETTLLVRLLMTGTMLNCFVLLPYSLQIAYGWTKLSVYSNAIALVIDIPLLIFFIDRYGAAGAAAVWVILNAGYFFISVNIIHTRILPFAKWRWYLGDVLTPLAAAATVVVAARLLVPSPANLIALLATVGVTGVLATAAAAFGAPEARQRILLLARRRSLRQT